MGIESKTFCILPFTHFATKTDGDIKLCCRSHPIGNINDSSIEEVWNGERMRVIRKQLLNDERPRECDACWRHEDINVSSMRQRVNTERTELYRKNVEAITEDYSLPFIVPVIEAKFSNLCNLKCRMCHPLDSTSWAKDWTEIEHLMESANTSTYQKVKLYGLTNKPYVNGWEDNPKFWEELGKLAPTLDKIEFAGGEPLTDPMHYKVLEALKPYAHQITIKYSTNLTNLNYKKQNILEIWNQFKAVVIIISIDGVGEVYDYIRQGADYSEVCRNIELIKQHPKVVAIMGACTLQIYNIFSFTDIIDEFENVLNIRLHTHRVNYPRFLDARVIPRHIKEKLCNELELFKRMYPDDKNILKHVNDSINMLKGGDMEEQELLNFVEFSDRLDKVQGVVKTWRELLPELADYVKSRYNE